MVAEYFLNDNLFDELMVDMAVGFGDDSYSAIFIISVKIRTLSNF